MYFKIRRNEILKIQNVLGSVCLRVKLVAKKNDNNLKKQSQTPESRTETAKVIDLLICFMIFIGFRPT